MKTGGSPGAWVLPVLVGGLMFAGACFLFWFDPANYSFYPTCLFHKTTGLLCPGCGSLRALHQLLHGNVAAAFRLNPFLVLCLPIAICFVASFSVKIVRNQPVRLQAKWVWLFVGAGLVFGILRNLPLGPFTSLPR
jgi:hypothetical protein